MDRLPVDRMYCLRHGQTGRIWIPHAGEGSWLFASVRAMKRSWEILKTAGLVGSEFEEHEVVVVELRELRN